MEYAGVWQQYAYTDSDGQKPHYKMSFNTLEGIDDSWSLKYNRAARHTLAHCSDGEVLRGVVADVPGNCVYDVLRDDGNRTKVTRGNICHKWQVRDHCSGSDVLGGSALEIRARSSRVTATLERTTRGEERTIPGTPGTSAR